MSSIWTGGCPSALGPTRCGTDSTTTRPKLSSTGQEPGQLDAVLAVAPNPKGALVAVEGRAHGQPVVAAEGGTAPSPVAFGAAGPGQVGQFAPGRGQPPPAACAPCSWRAPGPRRLAARPAASGPGSRAASACSHARAWPGWRPDPVRSPRPLTRAASRSRAPVAAGLQAQPGFGPGAIRGRWAVPVLPAPDGWHGPRPDRSRHRGPVPRRCWPGGAGLDRPPGRPRQSPGAQTGAAAVEDHQGSLPLGLDQLVDHRLARPAVRRPAPRG